MLALLFFMLNVFALGYAAGWMAARTVHEPIEAAR